MASMEENIRVVVRSRPLSDKERKAGDEACVAWANEGKEVQIRVNAREAQAFRCDAMLMGETTQEDFFNKSGMINLLDSAMGGYRACVFAFGQTGAGKTHTVIGGSTVVQSGSEECGIMGRSFDYIYEKLQGLEINFTVKIACMEIYQEQLFDLLVGEKERSPLAVREHQTDGFFVEGCKLTVCPTVSDAVNALNKALRHRQVGAHQMNHRSNRSHFITEVFIELPAKELLNIKDIHEIPGFENLADNMDRDSDREYNLMGRVTVVDLAGSERLKETKSEGKTLQEAGNINKSLYVLGKVISGMSRQHGAQNHRDVPYRDSKLTKLLIHSLGGNSRTMMLSCISGASSAIPETLRTLHFSMSAARIKNKPLRFMDPVEKLILELREEIKRLKNENRVLKSNLMSAPNSAAVSMKSFSAHGDHSVRSSHQSKLGAELQKIIAESGAADQEYDDIVYNTPDSKDPPGRGGRGHQAQPVRRSQPVVVRKKNKKNKSVVEEMGKYDMHGRPKAKKKIRDGVTYDNAGHVQKRDNGNRRQPQISEPVRRNNGYERQHPPDNSNNSVAQRKNKPPGGRGGGARGWAAGGGPKSPHRSVSVPVIRIVNNKAADDRHMPVATGHKKQTKSPFLAHLDNKKKKKSPLSRVETDPNHLPPVNLSRDEDIYSSDPPHNPSNRYGNGPRSNSSYNRAASRYKNATKPKIKPSKAAAPPKSPSRPTKVQLPHISKDHSKVNKAAVPTKARQLRGGGALLGRGRDNDSDSDDGIIFHSTAGSAAPPPRNRYDDPYESPVQEKRQAQVDSALTEMRQSKPKSSAGGGADVAAMNTSLNLESVKDKLARMEQQLVIRRQQVEGGANKGTAADRQEARSRLEALEEEVRDMQLEVQISAQLQGIQYAMLNKKSVAEKFPPVSPPNTRNLAESSQGNTHSKSSLTPPLKEDKRPAVAPSVLNDNTGGGMKTSHDQGVAQLQEQEQDKESEPCSSPTTHSLKEEVKLKPPVPTADQEHTADTTNNERDDDDDDDDEEDDYGDDDYDDYEDEFEDEPEDKEEEEEKEKEDEEAKEQEKDVSVMQPVITPPAPQLEREQEPQGSLDSPLPEHQQQQRSVEPPEVLKSEVSEVKRVESPPPLHNEQQDGEMHKDKESSFDLGLAAVKQDSEDDYSLTQLGFSSDLKLDTGSAGAAMKRLPSGDSDDDFDAAAMFSAPPSPLSDKPLTGNQQEDAAANGLNSEDKRPDAQSSWNNNIDSEDKKQSDAGDEDDDDDDYGDDGFDDYGDDDFEPDWD